MFARIIRCLNARPVQWSALRNASALYFTKRNATAANSQAVLGTARPYEDIPGPNPLPILGNAWRFIPGLGELSEIINPNLYVSLYKQFGKILKITGIPGRESDIVMVFDADDIEKVFRNEGPWPSRIISSSITHYRTVTRKDMFQGMEGLLVTQGEAWQKFRTKVNQVMMQPRSTKLYVGPIDAVANDFIERIRFLKDDKEEMPAHFIKEINKWAMESIVYIALDTRLGCLEKDLQPESEPHKLLNAIENLLNSLDKLETGFPIWKFVSTPTWRAFVKASDFFFELSMKYINEAIERLNSLPKDPDRELTILEKILARDPDPKTGVVMAVDMMGAGVDTTSYTLSIALYYLAKYPEKQEKLFEEIKRFVPNKQQPITSEILHELKYLKACVKESMRMSPIVPLNCRKLFKDQQLAGYHVPKGTDVLMPFIFVNNQEKYFQQANKFIPERWLKDGPYSNTKMHPFVNLPFGFGPRMCIGRRFAELEIDTLVTKMIRNFRISYNYGDMKFKARMFYAPVSPLKFKMEERES